MEAPIWSITQLISDSLMVLAVGLATPLIKHTKNIYHRGFFCNDEDIMHPLKSPSFVESRWFHFVGVLINIVVIVFVEYFLYKKYYERITFWRFKLSMWIYNTYSVLLSFAFGVLICILITTVLKGSIGRLRPSFINACIPNINCSLLENHHVYHINYECTNKNFEINNRLSFPSGHSSFSMFCGIFLAIYVQKRIIWNISKLFKSCIQFALMLIVLYVGGSRVSDFKHHWSDVLAGYLIGGLCAVLVCINLYGNFHGLPLSQHKPKNCVSPDLNLK
ncbi:hypothetical protein Zmor_017887 [Zophobas morio]|uniref:Phosphatidic acid phosphatase type 2/haloperoxidase domain-containing protein n=1 Tax=Zophobas morio TaxID=2755281 RepID=A0AA38IDD1_9CUCU|nr:hypothetical protein Zmor_017887 [Zophobas morio]